MTDEQRAALEAAMARAAKPALTPEQQQVLEAAQMRLAEQNLPQGDIPQPSIAPASGRDIAANRTFGDMIADNLVGRDDGVQSVGETLAATLNNGGEALTFGVVGDEAAGFVDGLRNRRGMDAAGNTEFYRQQEEDLRANNPALYWGSEILPAMAAPGAALGAGGGLLSRVLGSGVVGGVGGASFGFSEAEGNGGERFESAQDGLLLGAGLGAAIPAIGAAGARVISPMRNADPERAALAARLDEAGVRNLTAGQRTGSEGLLRAEDMLQPSMEQLEDFTAAAMRTAGSSAPRATTTALREAQEDIVQRMDDALDGVSVTPDSTMAQAAEDIATRYSELVPAGSLTPRVRGIAEEIIEQATAPNPKPISLDLMRRWRTEIGTLRTSNDPATREAAQGLASLIDDATDSALTAAGRTDDIAALGAARNEYRNLIALQTASTRAGVNPRVGILSPEALRSITAITQGRRQVAQGKGTDLDSLANAGAGILAPLPTVMAGGHRILPQAANLSSGLAGAMPGLSSGSPMLAAAGAVAAPMAMNAAQTLGQRMLRSRPVAGILANRMVTSGQQLDDPLRRGLLGGLAAQ